MSLARLLDLREGEGRVVLVLFTHLFFITAAAIVLSAAKNGLFLSAYPAALIPHVIVAAAATTAAFAILFTGLTGGLSRRVLVEATAGVAALSLLASRAAFLADPRWAFGIYLWLSILGALVVTLAWGSVGDLLTGRQSRRLMPLLIGGTSVAGVGAGFGLAPAVAMVGTPNLLVAAAAALLLGAGVLRLGPRPAASQQRPGGGQGFVARVRRGALLIRGHGLLALLAGGVVLGAIVATLVDYQFKAVLQEAYDRDAITSLFGVLAGAVGVGTLVMQAVASRVLFRRWGLVSGSYAQAALIGATALSVAATGWLAALAALRFADETGRFTLQKTVEQVSVAPYTPDTRTAALTVLGGVLKPVATALTGLLLMLVAPLLGVRGLALLTAAAALALFALFRRHPRLYRAALEEALARHALQLDGDGEGALAVVDRNALEVLDRALENDDPALLIFAISILRRAPRVDALPRLDRLVDHEVPEVRAEAAVALTELAGEVEGPELERLRAVLRQDPSPDVVRALLDVAERLGGSAIELVAAHLDHEEESVRRRALVALARCETRFGGDRATRLVEGLLASDLPEDRAAGLDAVAVLGFGRLAEAAYEAGRDARTRPAAVAALAALGEPGEAWIDRILSDPALTDADLEPIATQLADAGHLPGLRRLLEVAAERRTGGAILGALNRARRRGRMQPVPAALMRRILAPVIGDGARYGLLAEGFRRTRRDPYMGALWQELDGRHRRAGDAVLAGLALSYDPARLDRVAPHLRAGTAATRSNALELLEGLLEPDDRRSILPFFEGYESLDRLEEAARAVGATVERAGRDPLAALGRAPDPWLRRCAAFVEERVRAHAGPMITTDPLTLESAMLPLMEIVFFLKSSPLFAPLPGEELARIASLAETRHLEPDQVLFQQGDPGDAFYMVVSGEVAVEVGKRRVATYGPREGIGEMALLDGEPRSATVRATAATTLLRIDQASFEALVDRTPALSKAIYRALCGRLRTANLQLQA